MPVKQKKKQETEFYVELVLFFESRILTLVDERKAVSSYLQRIMRRFTRLHDFSLKRFSFLTIMTS